MESESESEDDPFSHSTTCMVGGRTWTVSEQLTPDALTPLFDDEWTGSIVWRCSLELAALLPDLIVARRPPLAACAAPGAPPPKRLRAVELGSGCGLVAMHACALGYTTLATDQGSMVPLIARNGAANLSAEELARFAAAELVWSADAARDVADSDFSDGGQGKPFDVLLVSDCLNPIYGEESYAALGAAVLALRAPGSLLVLAFEARGVESRPAAAVAAIAAQVAACVASGGRGHAHTFAPGALAQCAAAAMSDADDVDAEALATLELGEPLTEFFAALCGGALTLALTLERVVMAGDGSGGGRSHGGEAPIMVYSCLFGAAAAPS